MKTKKLPEFILECRLQVFLVIVLAVIAGVQELLSYEIKDWTVEANCECKVIKVGSVSDFSVVMDVEHQGKKYWTQNATVIISYINNPGPMQCKLYKTGKAECKLRPVRSQ